jgi:hypothetical protein
MSVMFAKNPHLILSLRLNKPQLLELTAKLTPTIGTVPFREISWNHSEARVGGGGAKETKLVKHFVLLIILPPLRIKLK